MFQLKRGRQRSEMGNEETTAIWYFPNDIEKQIISGLCNEIIDILSPLKIEQKAFALRQLVSSFEDITGTKIDSILELCKEPETTQKDGETQ